MPSEVRVQVKIPWATPQKVIDMTEVFLSCCCPPGKPVWLLEDPDFITSVMFIASFVYDEGAYLTALASFVSGMSKHSKELADKVTFLRIKKYRPDIYNSWLTDLRARLENKNGM